MALKFVFNPFTGRFDAVDIAATPVEEAYTFMASCTSAESVEDCVYISADPIASVLQVRRADISDPSKMPAVGVIVDKPSPTTALVAYFGACPIDDLPTHPGKVYFVGASSKPVAVRPSAPAMIQTIGVALGDGKLLLNPSTTMTKVI